MQQTVKSTLTRAELAAELGVSVFTLNQWAVMGKGPKPIRIGRQCVYRREDVDAYLKAQAKADAPVQAAQPAGTYMMRLPEVLSLVGLSKSTLYSLIKSGDFAAPVKLGARAVAWPSHLVNQWLADRMGGDAA